MPFLVGNGTLSGADPPRTGNKPQTDDDVRGWGQPYQKGLRGPEHVGPALLTLLISATTLQTQTSLAPSSHAHRLDVSVFPPASRSGSKERRDWASLPGPGGASPPPPGALTLRDLAASGLRFASPQSACHRLAADHPPRLLLRLPPTLLPALADSAIHE